MSEVWRVYRGFTPVAISLALRSAQSRRQTLFRYSVFRFFVVVVVFFATILNGVCYCKGAVTNNTRVTSLERVDPWGRGRESGKGRKEERWLLIDDYLKQLIWPYFE